MGSGAEEEAASRIKEARALLAFLPERALPVAGGMGSSAPASEYDEAAVQMLAGVCGKSADASRALRLFLSDYWAWLNKNATSVPPFAASVAFPKDSRVKTPIIMYTDAMYEPTAAVPDGIGVAVYDSAQDPSEGGAWRHLYTSPPSAIYRFWRSRETYITLLETLAPLVALLSAPEDFRDRDVVLFIDNTGALFGIGKGDCRDPDGCVLILLLHIVCAALRVRLWVEYVPSGANVADEPSRGSLDRLLAWGSSPLVEASDVVWPRLDEPVDDAFRRLWGSLAAPESNAARNHRVEVAASIESLRTPQPTQSRRSRKRSLRRARAGA